MQKTESSLPDRDLQERPHSVEHTAEKSAEMSSSVVLENVQECTEKYINMLLENISGLAVDDEFIVEMIPELNVAVTTFLKNIGKSL